MEVKYESHGERSKRLAGVSHEHTPFPCPHAFPMTVSLPQQTSNQTNLNKNKNKTHSARHEVEKFVFSGCSGKELGAVCADQSL